MRDNIRHHLLDKEVTRKEFLQYVTGGLLMLFGLGNILSLLHHSSRQTANKTAATEGHHGFGARKFGA